MTLRTAPSLLQRFEVVGSEPSAAERRTRVVRRTHRPRRKHDETHGTHGLQLRSAPRRAPARGLRDRRLGTLTRSVTPHDHSSHAHTALASQGLTQSDLRALLGRQLGEHAALAMNATNLGVTGSKAFSAAAKALDRNSVALSRSIAAVYGKQAGNAFLNGKFQWRDHIEFFVDYTVAVAKKDRADQNRAVRNLQRYAVEHGKLLGGATGLPPKAVEVDLLQHVLELKAQLDAYSKGQYAKAARLYQDAYAHMFMTADLLAEAIAKQKNLPK